MTVPAGIEAPAKPALTPASKVMARVTDARHDAPVRGDAALAAGERAWMRVERILGCGLPEKWNPFAYTGALAGYTFIIAAATGVLLLLWYDTSVHTAYASIAAMEAQPWGSGLIRTLHRYSSDACVLFSVIHAIKVLLSRRFTGARWIAWVTGIILLGLIWLDGWLGYWLTWDQRAQAIAVGTAQVLDTLPIFPQPVALSFLTNGDINSLIFFAVFFAHVLLPVPIGAVIWIHLVRLRKPRFLPSRKLALVTLGVLILVSLVVPAALAAPADMAVLTSDFDIDWFYLLPLFLTDRVGGVAFWVIALVLLVGLCGLPVILGRRRRAPAAVNTPACNGCTQCFQDCPYEAITMVPAEGKEKLVSLIDPARCVSCGVCVGSCDPGAIKYPELDRPVVRDRIRGWLDDAAGPHAVMFLCADSTGRKLRVDPETGLCDGLPGWRVVPVPCAAWVHSSLVEMISRKGGRAMIVACESSEPRCRLGADIAQARAENRREPEFMPERIAEGTFRFLRLEAGSDDDLRQAAGAFLDGAFRTPLRVPGKARLLICGALTTLVLVAVMVVFSRFVYVAPDAPPSMLVVAFKLAGDEEEAAEDVASELPHMQGMKKRTRRMPVWLRVTVDGVMVHEQAYEPKGVRGDSASLGTVELAMQPGAHEIVIALRSSGKAGGHDDHSVEKWDHIERRRVDFEPNRRRVVQFENGFRWDGEEVQSGTAK